MWTLAPFSSATKGWPGWVIHNGQLIIKSRNFRLRSATSDQAFSKERSPLYEICCVFIAQRVVRHNKNTRQVEIPCSQCTESCTQQIDSAYNNSTTYWHARMLHSLALATQQTRRTKCHFWLSKFRPKITIFLQTTIMFNDTRNSLPNCHFYPSNYQFRPKFRQSYKLVFEFCRM